MERTGNLMERICSLQNLEHAFLKASAGKNTRPDIIAFRSRLGLELQSIAEDLLSNCYILGSPRKFTLYDPKRRIISAATFRDRVTFHAVMNICHDRFEKHLIYDSYASRKGKGTYAALQRALFYAGRYNWFLKLDVVKYFDSIDHNVLKHQLSCLFKDPRLLSFFCDVIDNHESETGLPIGNLTSQYFANHYLSVADHFLKEKCKAGPMIRYMDDIIVFCDSSKELLRLYHQYRDFLSSRLKLELHEPILNRVSLGAPFLGYVVYPRYLRLSRRSVTRFIRKVSGLHSSFVAGKVGQVEYARRLDSLFAFVLKADSLSLRKKVLNILELSS